MKIRKNRYLIVLFAALLLFSNVASAVNHCLMVKAEASDAVQHADHDDPCCDTEGAAQPNLPDDCCAVLAAEHRNEAPPALAMQLPEVAVRALPIVAWIASWGEQRVVAAPSVLRNAGPPLNLVFKNFRI